VTSESISPPSSAPAVSSPNESTNSKKRYTIIYRVTLPGGAHSTAKNGIELDRLVTDALKRGLKPEIEVLT
jgi:hypothetical protein